MARSPRPAAPAAPPLVQRDLQVMSRVRCHRYGYDWSGAPIEIPAGYLSDDDYRAVLADSDLLTVVLSPAPPGPAKRK